MNQMSFNPANYMVWEGDWYNFNDREAHKSALKARNTEAKRLRAQGKTVYCGSRSGQLITRGGIGSGHPEISMVVTVYYLNY
jgi:hypothetical protein